MQFVPLWTSILRSQKVAAMPDDLYRMWILCLVVAQEHDHRSGSLPCLEDLAYTLHLDAKECESRASRLNRDGFLDLIEGVYLIHDWGDWKVKNDPTGALRSRRYREKVKEEKGLTEMSKQAIVTAVTAVTHNHGNHGPTNLTSTTELSSSEERAA